MPPMTDRLKVFVPPTESSAVLPINVKDPAYGAVGDGTTDDTAAINAAITAAGATRSTYFPAGTYKITSRLDLTASVTLVGDGQGKTTIATDGTFDHLRVQGTKGGNLTVASNVAADAATIVLSDASSLAAGDYIVVSSALAWPGGSTGTYGEIVRIKSISTNTLTLYGAVDEAYATANTAVVNKLTMVQGVKIEGITFKGVTNAGTFGAVQLTYCRDVLVDNCEFRNLDCPGFQPNTCLSWVVRDSTFRDLTDNTGAGRLGYGVNANGASRSGRVEGCYFEYCRHGFTTNGSAEGVPRHIVVANCVGRAMSSTTFDTHEEGRYISFVGCDANGSAASGGFKLRAPDCLVEACTTTAVNDHGVYVAPYGDRARVRGGTFESRGATSAGIQIEAVDAHITGATVTKAGDRCLRVKSGGDRATIKGCVLKNPAQDSANSICLDVTTAPDVLIDGLVCESATTGVSNVSGTNLRMRGLDAARTVTTPYSGTILQPDRAAVQQKRTGVIAPTYSPLWAAANSSIVSATQYWARFVLPEDLIITKLGFLVAAVGNAVNTDTCDVGIFAADGTTKLVSSGSTAAKVHTQGLNTITVATTTLTADTVYYASWTATIASLGAFTMDSAVYTATGGSASFGSAVPNLDAGKLASVGTTLSTSGPGSASNNVPLIWLLES